MKTLASFSYSWNIFNKLKTSYSASSQKVRKSNLKSRLHNIDLLCSELVTLIKKCHDCKTSASMNVSLLSRTYLEKLTFIKEIISKIGQIQLKISDNSLLNDIRRHLKQQQNNQVNIISRKPHELTKCSCYNNSDHTWEKTFDNILEMENSRIVQQPLSCENLKDIANIMSENIVT